MQCVIERKPVIGFGERHTRFVNLKTGDEFLYLGGGFAWPSEKPGFVVVVGVMDDDRLSEPTLGCLVEHQTMNMREMVQQSIDLAYQYGGNYEELNWFWAGIPDNPQVAYGKWLNDGLAVKPCWKADDPGVFQTQMHMVKDMIDSGHLLFGDCDALKAHVSAFPADAHMKGSTDKYPALAALGAIVSTLLTYKPWRQIEQDRGRSYFDELQEDRRKITQAVGEW